ncbi:NAD(P)/FAD-dependent oxidoreductase [Caldimonas tepidiphila]|uniref:NAD(P)/FAD-dependent oxidoreductase n=1 Tax=Caldimonas tepidiphila TaxID=2315841 RepID=UPI000E5BBA4C|nr:FAD-dependent oxidoreductase [Caldimonas tepidiphila]
MKLAKESMRVAVIGAGIAGITCARRLSDAGHAVQLFDKSRGVGGRLATRRVDRVEQGLPRTLAFDHGAPAFTARSTAFLRFVGAAAAAGWLARWTPAMAPGGHAEPPGDAVRWVPVPDMPSLCRRLLGDMPVALCCEVDALQHDVHGWRLLGRGATLGRDFDRVVLALPAPQAAGLLLPHRPDWAQQARQMPMLPCWALMGAAEPGLEPPDWEAAAPRHGPLAWIARDESKPGRDAAGGLVRWVVQAGAEWSREHLEAPAPGVQELLQAALADWLGRPVRWHHAAVHRWRYASVQRQGDALSGRCWWDAAAGLGVCGDFLGGAGVEGSWLSARALADTMSVAHAIRLAAAAPRPAEALRAVPPR